MKKLLLCCLTFLVCNVLFASRTVINPVQLEEKKNRAITSFKEKFDQFYTTNQAALLSDQASCTTDYDESLKKELDEFLEESVVYAAHKITEQILEFRPFFRLQATSLRQENHCLWTVAVFYNNAQALSAIKEIFKRLSPERIIELKNILNNKFLGLFGDNNDEPKIMRLNIPNIESYCNLSDQSLRDLFEIKERVQQSVSSDQNQKLSAAFVASMRQWITSQLSQCFGEGGSEHAWFLPWMHDNYTAFVCADGKSLCAYCHELALEKIRGRFVRRFSRLIVDPYANFYRAEYLARNEIEKQALDCWSDLKNLQSTELRRIQEIIQAKQSKPQANGQSEILNCVQEPSVNPRSNENDVQAVMQPEINRPVSRNFVMGAVGSVIIGLRVLTLLAQKLKK